MLIFAKLTAAAVSVLLCVFLVRSHFTPGKISPRKCAALLGGGFLILSAGTVLWSNIFVPALLTAVVAGGLCCFAGQADPQKAAVFGLAFGLMRLAASGTALLISHYFPANRQCTLLMEVITLYALVAYASVFSEQWYPISAPLLQLLPGWVMAVILCEEAIRNQYEENVILLEIIAIVWLIYTGVQLIHVGNRMEGKVRELQKKQQKARHYALREEYYEQLRDKQAETRALWHDLNKYLRAAKAEAPSAQALDQLEAMLDSATKIVDVGNQVLNVILNEYAQGAKAAGIDLRLKVRVPSKIAVSVADLYILIGNTMDNAVEACSALPTEQRVIDLLLRTHHDVLYYKLTNPYDPTQTRRAPEPMRGHGLANVRRCMEKYGGSVDVVDENGFFTVTAHLNVDSTEQQA